SGCIHWSFKAAAGVRNSPVITTLGAGDNTLTVAVFGDLKANLYALNASTGELLWQKKADEHIAARMTASPAYHEGIIYVPMSAWEEGAGRAQSYPCCTFRGSISAYDA